MGNRKIIRLKKLIKIEEYLHFWKIYHKNHMSREIFFGDKNFKFNLYEENAVAKNIIVNKPRANVTHSEFKDICWHLKSCIELRTLKLNY